MTDNGLAALAEALEDHSTYHPDPDDDYGYDPCGTKCAAAILAALPPDWCGHSASDDLFAASNALLSRTTVSKAEIARLRKIEEAAREVAEDSSATWSDGIPIDARLLATLRAALAAKETP